MTSDDRRPAARVETSIQTAADLDAAIAAAGLRASPDGRRRRIPCPAPGHLGDRSASNCAVWVASSGSVGAVCHSHGCAYDDILRGLGALSQTANREGDSRSARRGKPDTARSRIVATYDYRDRGGELLFQVVRYTPKGFRQRRPDRTGGWTWSTKGVERVLYRLPELLAADRDETVFICEGEKDADNLAALGLVATTAPGGAGKWRQLSDLSALTGRRVVALPDNDSGQQGLRHCKDVAASLAAIASSVKVLSLPGLAPAGEDVSDWIGYGGTAARLIELARDCPEWGALVRDEVSSSPSPQPSPLRERGFCTSLQPNRYVPSPLGEKVRMRGMGEGASPSLNPPLPRIDITRRHLRDITSDAVAALLAANGNSPTLFARGGRLARLVTSEDDVSIEVLGRDAARGVLDRAANFVKVDRSGGLAPTSPPPAVVGDVLSLPSLPMPPLRAVYRSPVYLPNRRLLSEDGYDAGSGIYVSTSGLGRTSASISPAEAVGLLKDALSDFPFLDAPSAAHAMAMIVQPFVRPLIDGPTPLYLIDAPTRGTGKTLLANLACLLSDGSAAHAMAMPRSDEELEKRITALLIAGHGTVLIDNVDRKLGGGSMAAALTTITWRGRVLGRSEMLDIPNNATWLATGNNVEVSDEVARRIALIRLDSGVERPEERIGFRHPDLLGWARNRRRRIVSAALSIVRQWLDAGAPRGRAVFGGFESWAAVMGGILDVAGVDGFLGNRDYLYAVSDLESREWDALCAAWHVAHSNRPVRTTDVLAVAKDNALLMPLWADRTERGAQTSFGRALRERRDRVFGGFRIRFAGESSAARASTYALEQVGRSANRPFVQKFSRAEKGLESLEGPGETAAATPPG